MNTTLYHLHRLLTDQVGVRRIMLLFATVLAVFQSVHAQVTNPVKGTVSSQSDGKSLPGVTVIVKGTTNGTVTDAEGNYVLSVPGAGSTLVFSYIGFINQEVPVGGKSTINVSLLTDTKSLEEVVVVGYGTQRKSDVTSAIAKVGGEDLQVRPVARVDQALQGQLAGVQVQQPSGRPGKAAEIKVRGIGSISAGANPLYVVDGFPIDATTFANMNLSDIESIEVLKDAASASIYGSRGSNGVVIITTKQGKAGDLKLDVKAYAGIQNVERLIPMMNTTEWLSMLVDGRDRAWVKTGGDPNAPMATRPRNYQYDPVWKTNPANVPYYNHQKWPYRTAPMQDFQITASGGSAKAKYLVSADYFKQDGIVKNTDYTRYSFRTNVSVDVNDYLNVGLNLTPSYSVSNDRDTEGKGGVLHTILYANPFLPIRTGIWGESPEYTDYSVSWDGGANVVSRVENLIDKETRGQMLANVFATVKLAKGLSFKTSFGANYISTKRDRFENQIISRTRAPIGESWNTVSLNWLNENILNYATTINTKHSITALAGFTSQRQNDQSGYLRGENFANDLVPTLNAAGKITQGNTNESEWSLLSYLGRVNYAFDNKYLISASLRRDGSSRFGADNKWGWFPAASIGWRISEEAFMKSVPVLSDLKLRASRGTTGNNNIPNYGAVGLLGQSAYLFGTDEAVTVGMYPNSISNRNLSWETTTSTDIGLDVGVWQNRIYASIDYYNNQTKDLLLNVPVPTVTGFSSELRNLGRVENKGWEFEVATKNLVGKFQWNTNLNLSFNKNRVLQLGPGNAPIIGGDWWGQVNITQVGQPIGAYYMLVQEGIWNTKEEIAASPSWAGSQPGDVRIKDVNGDGKINIDDRTIVGQNQPKYYFGITNRFSYAGFDLSVLIYGLGGNKIFNDIGREFNGPSDSQKNHYQNWVNRWQSPEKPGDGTTPAASELVTGASSQYTTRHLYDGGFWRIKNVSLGYNVPKTVSRKIKAGRIRLYATGENLLTVDKYDVGYNPEVNTRSGNPLAPGGDYGSYPLARTFILGLNVTF
ncbi:SusC/RagA family TonB-linked outer membrane protein [Larkinella terrae]|uniref:SusC/RagA family TonB-linked outer membrane protein n=1 Tax=Larkinella terrae TaxID=2025311 RepID=A0A7K0EG42_9BACT|nr:TonB-dependent receptor [Larkinella terrae]MRS60416.1 SusC/RagA family TonB-linked outer membrane protein [Larkinella terrae]